MTGPTPRSPRCHWHGARERGRLDIAAELAAPLTGTLGRFGEIPAYVLAQILLARVNHAQGRRDAAFACLDEARVLPSGRVVAGYFSDRIAFERSRLALVDGDLATAENALPDWQERLDRGARTMDEHLLLARFLVEAGDNPTLLLATTPQTVEVTPVYRIEEHKLRALLALRERDDTTALGELTAAMRIAAHTGHRQTFLDDEASFGAVLDNAVARSGHRLRDQAGPAARLNTDTRAGARLAEPLTERELAVVRLLPSHLTYDGIAEAMTVSPNTVKSYLKSIYIKFDASKRSKAVANARSLGIID